MESFEAEIVPILHSPDFKTRYVIHTEITSIEEHKVPAYVSGFGESTVFVEKSLGWFAYLQGSHEALHLGMDKPTLAKGDKVRITVEKV